MAQIGCSKDTEASRDYPASLTLCVQVELFCMNGNLPLVSQVRTVYDGHAVCSQTAHRRLNVGRSCSHTR